MNKITKIMSGLIVIFGIAIGSIYYTNYMKSQTSTNIASNTTNVSNVNWVNYDSNTIELEDKSVEITKEGTYTLSGTITNGQIKVNVNGNVKLILNGVSITNTSGPAIYIESGTVEIETVENTTNTLMDGTSYTGYETDVAGVIYSKDDLILSGEGTLKVTANYEDAIVSKDDLQINSGNYVIVSKDDAIRGKDSIEINDGTFDITSGGDAIKTTNDTDSDKGNIVINNGTFNIKCTTDGIDASGDAYIKNGTFTIDSDDDGIHVDGKVEIDAGTIKITAHEGIEGTYVVINGGDITINASDDGINAGNKTNEYNVLIEINGGNININMGQGDTDGVDSNGDIVINGGTISVTGQSTFDYDGTGTINGGTVICNGEEVSTLPNQFMGGGPGGMQGGPMNEGNTPQDRGNYRGGR